MTKLTLALPDWVHAFRYVRNCHYIELEDKEGNKARLEARTLLRVECSTGGCPTRLYVDWVPGTEPTTLGVPPNCLHCGGMLRVAWGTGQLAFVPEGETTFVDPHTGDIVRVGRE